MNLETSLSCQPLFISSLLSSSNFNLETTNISFSESSSNDELVVQHHLNKMSHSEYKANHEHSQQLFILKSTSSSDIKMLSKGQDENKTMQSPIQDIHKVTAHNIIQVSNYQNIDQKYILRPLKVSIDPQSAQLANLCKINSTSPSNPVALVTKVLSFPNKTQPDPAGLSQSATQAQVSSPVGVETTGESPTQKLVPLMIPKVNLPDAVTYIALPKNYVTCGSFTASQLTPSSSSLRQFGTLIKVGRPPDSQGGTHVSTPNKGPTPILPKPASGTVRPPSAAPKLAQLNLLRPTTTKLIAPSYVNIRPQMTPYVPIKPQPVANSQGTNTTPGITTKIHHNASVVPLPTVPQPLNNAWNLGAYLTSTALPQNSTRSPGVGTGRQQTETNRLLSEMVVGGGGVAGQIATLIPARGSQTSRSPAPDGPLPVEGGPGLFYYVRDDRLVPAHPGTDRFVSGSEPAQIVMVVRKEAPVTGSAPVSILPLPASSGGVVREGLIPNDNTTVVNNNNNKVGSNNNNDDDNDNGQGDHVSAHHVIYHQQQQHQLMMSSGGPKSYGPGPAGIQLGDPNSKSKKRCNCTKSQCLKLYCECFASGEFCQNCNCNNCSNNLEHEDDRKKAIKGILERNPMAFHPKIGKSRDGEIERKHCKGCNCRRSGCLKNYCECYEAKIACSSICKCVGCKNYEDSLERRSIAYLCGSVAVHPHHHHHRSLFGRTDQGGAGAETSDLVPSGGDIWRDFETSSLLVPALSHTGPPDGSTASVVADMDPLTAYLMMASPGLSRKMMRLGRSPDSSHLRSPLGYLGDGADLLKGSSPFYPLSSSSNVPGLIVPSHIITDEIVEAIVTCMVAQAYEALFPPPNPNVTLTQNGHDRSHANQTPAASAIDYVAVERAVTAEFGQCLLRIINVAKATPHKASPLGENGKSSSPLTLSRGARRHPYGTRKGGGSHKLRILDEGSQSTAATTTSSMEEDEEEGPYSTSDLSSSSDLE